MNGSAPKRREAAGEGSVGDASRDGNRCAGVVDERTSIAARRGLRARAAVAGIGLMCMGPTATASNASTSSPAGFAVLHACITNATDMHVPSRTKSCDGMETWRGACGPHCGAFCSRPSTACLAIREVTPQDSQGKCAHETRLGVRNHAAHHATSVGADLRAGFPRSCDVEWSLVKARQKFKSEIQVRNGLNVQPPRSSPRSSASSPAPLRNPSRIPSLVGEASSSSCPRPTHLSFG